MSTTTDFSDTARVAFCQNCGRPLTAAEVRNVGPAIYCEPCLVAKVAAADASTAAGQTGAYGFSGTSSGVNYEFQGTMPPPVAAVPGAPNPGLAALLGFIPGVGAFYNGQYAKGIVHLVVFAILTSLSGQNGIFGLFVAGWVFYQVIEAHHTARARRDGTSLPNPFGLNDIGERLGFGRAWPGATAAGSYPPPGTYAPPASAPYGGPIGEVNGPPPPPPPVYGAAPPLYSSHPPPPPSWGASAETYAPPSSAPSYAAPDVDFQQGAGRASRFPTGAIFLIGLGVIFLIGNSGVFRGFPIHRLIPFLLISVGVWLFVHRMTEAGGGLADDGQPGYQLRLFRAVRGSVWVVLVGVLFLLDTFGILSWGRSWPLFIIVGGLMTFFQRAAYASALPMQYAYPAPAAAVPPAGPGAPVASPVAPTASRLGEEK